MGDPVGKQTRTSISLVLLVAFVALICAPLSALGEKSKTATLNIEGMTCGVRIVLKKVGGVSDAKVSFDDKKAVVTYDPAKTTPQKMVEAINAKLPYKARVTDSGAPPKP